MASTPVATIGFTRSTAESFFDRLLAAKVKTVVDVRLHNTSQLAGFAKADDLAFFLERIGGIGYRHEPLLAPDEDLLAFVRKAKGDWQVFESRFLGLMADRRVEDRIAPESLDGACLLCSEPTAHRCHRRLVVDYLNGKWGGRLAVRHL